MNSVSVMSPATRISAAEITDALSRLGTSPLFDRNSLHWLMLDFIVRSTRDGVPSHELNESYLLHRVLGSDKDRDSQVRVVIGRVRDKLTAYYAQAPGSLDPIVIRIPKRRSGEGYGASFERNHRFELAQRLAFAVSRLLGRTIPLEALAPHLDAQGMNVEAHVLFVQGLALASLRTPEGYERSISYFYEALRLAPDYHRAHAGIAESLCSSAIFFQPPRIVLAEAEAAAQTALERDPGIWEAHAAMGMIRMCRHWDWAGARAAFAEAERLSPAALSSYVWYAVYRAAVGQEEEAIDSYRRALILQPAAAHVNLILGACLLASRRFEEAERSIRCAVDLAPGQFQARIYLMMVLLATARFDEALAAAHDALKCVSQPEKLYGFKVLCEAAAGHLEQAAATLEAMQACASRDYVGHAQFALAYQGLNDRDEAVRRLEMACADRDPLMVWLHRWPIVDPLRSHPAFKKLLRSIAPPDIQDT